MRLTEEQYAEMIARRGGRANRNATGKTSAPSKYRNQRCEVDGFKFDSKREGEYYKELKLRVKAGEVRWFIRQAPFDLPGERRYFADFLEVHADGSVHVVDVKGVETEVWKIKRDLFRERYGFDVEVVR
jgi:hypothetical protein